MNEYLLLFRNASNPGSYLATAEDMAEDMPRWQAWIGRIAMQGKLVTTAPITYEGLVVTPGTKTETPYKETSSVLVVGFLLCKADTLEEAETWAATCPVLKYPGGSVEIRPLIPFPVN